MEVRVGLPPAEFALARPLAFTSSRSFDLGFMREMTCHSPRRMNLSRVLVTSTSAIIPSFSFSPLPCERRTIQSGSHTKHFDSKVGSILVAEETVDCTNCHVVRDRIDETRHRWLVNEVHKNVPPFGFSYIDVVKWSIK